MRRALLLAALLAAPAAAEPGEIVVTALPLPRGDRAYDIVTIAPERLAASASGRLEDVLRDVAGFQQFRRVDSRSANPTSQGATLRALGGNAASRALVLLDGAPVADPFAGYIPWSALTPERLASVRVTRGAGAGAFGSGALAGTIELTSADPASLPKLQASVDFGSRNSLSAGSVVSTVLGSGSASVFGRVDRGDGYVLVPGVQRGPADIAAAYRQWSGGLHLRAAAGDDLALGLTALVFDDRRVRGVAGNTSRVSGAMTSMRLAGTGRWAFEALGYVEILDFANRTVSLDAARAVATPALDQYRTPATGWGGKLELRPPVGATGQLRIGIDARVDEGRTLERARFQGGSFTRRRDAGGRNTVTGGYVEVALTPIARLTLTGGARLDRWQLGDGALTERDAATGAVTLDVRPRARAGWEPTVRGGVAYDVTPALQLRGAAYLGYRLPTLNELYRPFRVGADATAANPGLAPERLRGVEAGVDYRPLASLRLSVTAFANRLDHAVANITIGTGPGVFEQVGFVAAGGSFRQRGNLDAIVARGVEASAHGAWRGFSLDASYAFTAARVHASGVAAALDGRPPAQTPAHQASATGSYAAPSGARGSLTIRYAGPQAEDDLGQRRLAAATTLDASVELPIATGIALRASAENLTDTLVQSGISASGVVDRAQPRTLWIGLRLRR